MGPVVANSAGSLNVGESSAHYSWWQRGDGSGGGADDGERQKDVTLLQWMSDHVVGQEDISKYHAFVIFSPLQLLLSFLT